jgi:hypothetical protein
MLAMYCQKDQKHWEEVLPQVMPDYRASVHSRTGVSPDEMFLGRNITMPLQAIIPRRMDPDEVDIQHIDEYICKLQGNLSKAHELARKCLKQNTRYQKKYYDSKAEMRKFQEGQPVWQYDASKKVGVCSKLTCKWKGPYVIIKRSEKQKGKVYHTDRLLPYKGRHSPKWYRRYRDKINNRVTVE